jgi:hypothetical protein
MALAVAAVYTLPFVLARGRVDAFYEDETYYGIRVVDAFRGGDLRNPYLAGHGHAPKYLPELTERALALAARALRVSPLTVLAVSRIVFAVAITLALTYFGTLLGLSPGMAILAGACPALFPPILTLLQAPGRGQHGFLRLFRIVSPAPHMLLLIIALGCVFAAWKEGRWRTFRSTTGRLRSPERCCWPFDVAVCSLCSPSRPSSPSRTSSTPRS